MGNKRIPIEKLWVMLLLSIVMCMVVLAVKDIDPFVFFSLDSYLQKIPIPGILTFFIFLIVKSEFKKVYLLERLHIAFSTFLFFIYSSMSLLFVGITITVSIFCMSLVLVTLMTPTKDEFYQIYTDF